MTHYEELLSKNKTWAKIMLKQDPDYFERLLHQQSPKFLWIGCSDSRVPANEITGTDPGEIFVHRNVANLVVNTDLNMLSVLQYAVEVLKVEHIIVCGHYGCGGVAAATTNKDFGLINKWLRNIKDVYRIHREDVDALSDKTDRVNRLVELNVMEQVNNLAKTTIIQKAWADYKLPYLHGWVYGLSNGLIKPLTKVEPGTHLDPLYEYDFDL